MPGNLNSKDSGITKDALDRKTTITEPPYLQHRENVEFVVFRSTKKIHRTNTVP